MLQEIEITPDPSEGFTSRVKGVAGAVGYGYTVEEAVASAHLSYVQLYLADMKRQGIEEFPESKILPLLEGHLISHDWDHIFRQALTKYGEEAQMEMALEECLELCVELQKYKRAKSTLQKISEETADTLVMALQLRMMLGPTKVDSIILQKLKRLEERMGGYGEGYE